MWCDAKFYALHFYKGVAMGVREGGGGVCVCVRVREIHHKQGQFTSVCCEHFFSLSLMVFARQGKKKNMCWLTTTHPPISELYCTI